MEGLRSSTQDHAKEHDYENLVIKRKVVSLVVASLIILSLIIFLAGFFWGYRRASHDVQIGINKTSFADQISYAALQIETQNVANANENIISENIINEALVNKVVEEIPAANQDSNRPELSDDLSNIKPATGYYAELIGFGRLQAAQAFVDKLKNKGYQVSIRKRISKTGNGKTVNWYQVITQDYTDKPTLQKMLDVLKKTERLQGIKIKSI